MLGARVRLVALLSVLVLALAVPATALAGGGVAGTDEPTPSAGTGAGGPAGTTGGGLAGTGFEVWKLGLIGLVCMGGSLVLVRSVRPVRT